MRIIRGIYLLRLAKISNEKKANDGEAAANVLFSLTEEL
jgi:hypothetical protein